MAFSSFLRSTTLEGVEQVSVDGQLPHDKFEQLTEQITQLGGITLGNLLCEPLISHGNGTSGTTISWYAAYEGDATRLTELESGARAAAEALLKARIEALQPVIAAAPDGPLIAAALYMPNLGDVFVINGEPVLTNWGIVPAGVQGSPQRRSAAFGAGLGALGLALAAPPLTAAEFNGWSAALPGSAGQPAAAPAASTGATPQTASGMASGAAAAGAATAATATAAHADPVADPVYVDEDVRVPWYRKAWAPALLAVIVAAAILIFLLIPGVLLYPEQPQVTLIEEETALVEDGNEALRQRLEDLRAARENGICTPEGNFVPGNGAPLTPGAPGDPAQPGANDQGSLIPPSPSQLQAPQPQAPQGSSQQTNTRSLLEHLDQAVVLVLAPQTDGVGVGTGFFVNPTQIVTNAHVISEGDPNQLFVFNPGLGEFVQVQVIADTGAITPGDADFAVLTSSDFPADQPYLPVSQQMNRADNVFAVGYPLITTGGDQFSRMVEENDMTDPPLMSVTRGIITTLQRRASGVEVIATDADISQGNSGGPLVDMCGRVLGVNTFTSLNRETSAIGRFSLHANTLREFLEANGVQATYDDSACTPAAPAPAPSPAELTVDPAADPAAEDPGTAEPVEEEESNMLRPGANTRRAAVLRPGAAALSYAAARLPTRMSLAQQ